MSCGSLKRYHLSGAGCVLLPVIFLGVALGVVACDDDCADPEMVTVKVRLRENPDGERSCWEGDCATQVVLCFYTIEGDPVTEVVFTEPTEVLVFPLLNHRVYRVKIGYCRDQGPHAPVRCLTATVNTFLELDQCDKSIFFEVNCDRGAVGYEGCGVAFCP
jgi:hypothetical protein